MGKGFYNILGLIALSLTILMATMSKRIDLEPDSNVWWVLLMLMLLPGIIHAVYFLKRYRETPIFTEDSLALAAILMGFVSVVLTLLTDEKLLSYTWTIALVVTCIPIYILGGILLEGKKAKKTQKREWNAGWIPLLIVGTNIVQLLFLRLYWSPENVPVTTRDWVTTIAIIGCAFPMTIFSIHAYHQFFLFGKNRKYRFADALDWNQPAKSLKSLKKLENNRDVMVLEDLLKFDYRDNQNKNPDNEELRSSQQTLRAALFNQIYARKERSEKLAQQLPYYWCNRCSARLKLHPVFDFEVAGCRICRKDDQLTKNVHQVIGVLKHGNDQPTSDGIWRLIAWDFKTNEFIPGDYDEIQVTEIPGFNTEWFIAAMLEGRKANYPLLTQKTTVKIQKDLPLSENTKRLLQAAHSENIIHLEYLTHV